MFVFKSILAINCLAIVFGSSIVPPAENIFQCLLVDNYKLLYNQTLHEDAVKDELALTIVNFPGENETNDKTITCVKLTNLNPGSGGEVKTMTQAVLERKFFAVIASGLGQPLDYLVKIYTT